MNMKLQEVRTRREVIEVLTAAGVTGEAAEAVCRETAAVRHAWRIEEAEAAARKAAEEVYGAGTSVLHLIALMLAELAGVGGQDGVSGVGTDRLNAFAQLGKGRKQASDGDAWTAAIRASLHRLALSRRTAVCGPLRIEADGPTVNLVERTPDGEIFLAVNFAELIPTAWVNTLAREGLRRSLGLSPWLDLPVPFSGTSEDWASTVNAVAAQMPPAPPRVVGY